MRVRGFMRLHGTDIECVADPHGPSSHVFLVHALPTLVSPGAPFVVASPSAWAELGAHNLARAYKPEGVA